MSLAAIRVIVVHCSGCNGNKIFNFFNSENDFSTTCNKWVSLTFACGSLSAAAVVFTLNQFLNVVSPCCWALSSFTDWAQYIFDWIYVNIFASILRWQYRLLTGMLSASIDVWVFVTDALLFVKICTCCCSSQSIFNILVGVDELLMQLIERLALLPHLRILCFFFTCQEIYLLEYK